MSSRALSDKKAALFINITKQRVLTDGHPSTIDSAQNVTLIL
jgi:hypothetical protein